MNKTEFWAGLGSNLGDRLENLRTALKGLEQAGVSLSALSPVYETPPWGNTDQPSFLNMVMRGAFEGQPLDLLRLMLETEKKMGRVREEKWGPRVIDLDLLLFGETCMQTPELTLPHPWMHERLFVLAPLADVNPDLVIPGMNKNVTQLLNETDPQERAAMVSLGMLIF